MPDVTLEQMLAARDERAARQAALAGRYGLEGDGGRSGAVVSVTLVVPGPDKTPPWAVRVFAAAMEQVERAIPSGYLRHTEIHDTPAGPNGFAVVTGLPAPEIKRLLVAAEEAHPWGRLFDLDVVVDGVPVRRSDVDAPERRCLVCDGPAAPCARSRAHDLPTLQHAIEEVLR